MKKYISIVINVLLITIIFTAPSKTEFSKAFISVAKKGNPAVVSIIAEKEITVNRRNQFFFPFDSLNASWKTNQFQYKIPLFSGVHILFLNSL